MNKRGSLVAGLLCLGMCVGLGAGATPAAASELFVTVEGARLRRKPVKKSKIIKRLSFGEPVQDLKKKSKRPMKGRLQCQDKRARWKQVKTKDGKKGWLWAPLLAKQAPVQGEDWRAVVAFRGRAESSANAWGDLIELARSACEAKVVHFHLATQK